jgi:hypothetical protein
VKTGTEGEDITKTVCCQSNSLSNTACTEAHINIAIISSVLLVANIGKYHSLVQNHGYAEKKRNHVFSHTIYLLNVTCSLNLPIPNPTQKIIFQRVTQ